VNSRGRAIETSIVIAIGSHEDKHEVRISNEDKVLDEDKATDQDKHEVRISNEDKALDDG
jgi:hypothetical protein